MENFIERNPEMTNTEAFTTEREIKLTLADLDNNIDRWGARFALKLVNTYKIGLICLEAFGYYVDQYEKCLKENTKI